MDISKVLNNTNYRAMLERCQDDPYKCRERLLKWFPNGPFAFVHDDHILDVADTLLGIVDDEDISIIESYLTNRTHKYRAAYERAKQVKTDYFYQTNSNPSINRNKRQFMDEDDVDYDCVLERLRLTIEEERYRSGYHHGQYECDLWILSQLYAYINKPKTKQKVAPVV